MSSVIMNHGVLLTTALIHFFLLRTSVTCVDQWPHPSSHLPLQAAAAAAVGEEKTRLGSTPPSCHNRCNACHPCKAVQVPTMPGQAGASYRRPADQLAGSQYYSNYKPLGWRCSCGAQFFSP